ncbi:Protein of unknown function [Pyronema omphalodes CBS 100304]|uniref:Uncharacterized protein n=1 Tax=Pyronema omphalodes (strain CBS 100304) TaxID=1076935 RepID=U4LAX6_PYROM|nr:Protein of unknown function [Pyronema omphalodes CBS 100304]
MIGYRPNLSTNSFPISARHELLPAPRLLTDAGNLNSTSFSYLHREESLLRRSCDDRSDQ